MIESMDDNQLKEYLQNRPESLKSVKTGKVAPGKKVKRAYQYSQRDEYNFNM